MRVMTLRLKMEIPLMVESYHISDGSSFTQVSTSFQNNSSECPSSNPRGVRVRTSHMGPITHLYSHKEAVVLNGSMGIRTLPWQPVAFELSEGSNSAHLGPTCSLHNDRSFPKHMGCFRINVVAQTLPPRNTLHEISIPKKICHWKWHTPQGAWIIKTRKD